LPSLSELLGVNAATAHPNSRVAKALASAGVSKTPELIRVVNLPRRKFDANQYLDASVLYAKKACGRTGCVYCRTGDPTLRLLQSAMIIEAAQCSGGFFNVGVGEGKTLASFLIHDACEARKTVLLVPAQLKKKTLDIDLPELNLHFRLPSTYDGKKVKSYSNNGVYVVAYEELSDTNSTDLLDKIRPDLIVADEAHRLRNPQAARTKRFLRYVRRNPCKFVAMTGSPMGKLLTDFAHLIELALGKNSPLPNNYPDLVQWSDCIDKDRTGIGALALLCEDDEDVRAGFQRRFRETPGVISTTESSAGMPIELRLFRVTPPAAVGEALDKLTSEWAWDGEEYDGQLDIVRMERELTQGFFYRLIWPSGIHGGNPQERDWLLKRRAWDRCLHKRLSHSNRVGQDSPALLEAMAERGEWTTQEWIDWLGVRDLPEPEKETIEISRWLVDICINWQISSQEPGIIWVDSPVVGQWLAQAGIPFYGEGEDDAVNALAANCLRAKISGQVGTVPTIALSMRAHGTGKNLQAWSRNLVLYPPASNDVWEQMIGRTHRPGQLDDVVTFDVVLGSESAARAMENALSDAKRISETLTQPQRLTICQECEPDDRLLPVKY
jgi:hypothetical protein